MADEVQHVYNATVVIGRGDIAEIRSIPSSSIRRTGLWEQGIVQKFISKKSEPLTSEQQLRGLLLELGNDYNYRRNLDSEELGSLSDNGYISPRYYAKAVLDTQVPVERSPIELRLLSDFAQAAIEAKTANFAFTPAGGVMLVLVAGGTWVLAEIGRGVGTAFRRKSQELTELLLDVPIRKLRKRLKSREDHAGSIPELPRPRTPELPS
jgi:hypothetical protein